VVPEVLVSGDHRRIRDWRRAEAERLTRERRPDLWKRYRATQDCDGAGDREVDQ
jgi:tRNA (guanine37-N1)-methyltransferase